MNICMMTNTYLPHVGGVARSVSSFAEEYRRRGHGVLVVAPEFEGAPVDGSEAGVVRVPAIQKFNGSDFSVRLPMAAMFNERLEGFGPKVIHSHHPFLLGDTALRVGAREHVPVIFTHHTLYEEYTHYLPFDSAAVRQFVIGISTEYANLCDGVIAPSESIADLLRKRGVETRLRTIPTGIDVKSLGSGDRRRGRKALGIPPRALVVGHVGRLAAEKNLRYLARSVCLFLKATPAAWFVVVGTGPVASAMRRIGRVEGVLNRMVFAGKKTGAELHDAYAAMDLFAFSSFSETQGLVVMEAMAAGLPVVALEASGVGEVIDKSGAGILLSADAGPEDFAAALSKLRKGPVRGGMSEVARRAAREFSIARCAEQALEFYEEVRTATRPARKKEQEDRWTAFLKRLEVEWDLVAEKTRAAVDAVKMSLAAAAATP